MRAVTILVLALLSSTVFAQVYTWRDAAGKVHYSDTPPTNMDSKKIHSGSQTSPVTSATTERSLAEKEMEFRKRKAESTEKQAKAEEDRKKSEESKRNCEDARNQLNALQSGQRMNRVNASGERISLDDTMRAQEIEKTKQAIKSWCK